ncbi:acetyltransferase EpsM [Pedobacter sp. AK013]|uniref:acetyltransferase n=1 Tax=Pedobacter sp. AK013 TaxID=2723071 RepID=UPI00160C6E0C|nr:acetyltransferase [Pedobacter sp. AK013]MBB6240236.1 acetyltransferase EpsM [Pedobacter sp. AK013]
MIDVYVLGAGKHATEVSEYFNNHQAYYLAGYVINVDHHDHSLLKSVIQLHDFLKQYPASPKLALIGAIGNYQRKSIIELLEKKGYGFINIIHPHNYLSPTLKMGTGNCIAPGCVINANVNIGNHCIINSNCNISHDCILENYVTISPGVTIAGNVSIKEGVFIGAGATVIPGVTIGNNAYIAAGACVTKDVLPHVMVAGVPAKVKKIID